MLHHIGFFVAEHFLSGISRERWNLRLFKEASGWNSNERPLARTEMTIPRKGMDDLAQLLCIEAVTPMDPFCTKEMETRIRLNKHLRPDPYITTILFTNPFDDVYAPFDAFIESGGTPMIIEDKGRNERHDRWRTWVFDAAKIDELKRLQSELGIKCYVTSSFTDGVVLMWDIDDEDSREFKKDMPYKTCDPSRGKVDKTLVHYSRKTAIRL